MNNFSTIEVCDDNGEVVVEVIKKDESYNCDMDLPDDVCLEVMDEADINCFITGDLRNCKINYLPTFFYTTDIRDKLLFLN